ncbi:MAG: hypothetical protein A2Z28_02400 [Chloroflexi bacterium RBG_16_51_9]|nr:MAG: hypothetical protein A2Z28_02400 [Chloroflexi bacterium RBG_16_51_9]
MTKNTLWLVVSCLMLLSLVMAACGQPAATPIAPTAPSAPTATTATNVPAAPTAEKPQQEAVKPTDEAPKYGGTLTLLPWGGEPTRWDGSAAHDQVEQGMWWGDWARGPAGGYGTGEASWTGWPSNFDLMRGALAESTKWTIDEAKNEGVIVYQIRQGVHWGLNPKSEASRLVNGREVTADDIVFQLKRITTDPIAYLYSASPEIRQARVTKTGPWEVTLNVPLDATVTLVNRIGSGYNLRGKPVPPEIVQKYGSMDDWKNSVGPGPFMLTDYIPASSWILSRNPNYWDKDPVGPGKGNQLPYVDSVKFLILPDASTRLAALRTGKLDRMDGVNWEDAPQMRRTNPELIERPGASGGGAFWMNTQKAPFNDLRVRKAALLATDLKTINDSLQGGLGQIRTYPWPYNKDYADLYLPDDRLTEAQKELYVYNPEKAKQLLKEAGFPSGFKVSAVITSGDVDFFSIIKDMWSKVSIDLTLDVKESASASALKADGNYDVARGGGNIISLFYTPPTLTTQVKSYGNVNDPVLNQGFADVRKTIMTSGMKAGVLKARELTPYIIDQVYGIPTPSAPSSTFWWPWVKNYSGEATVGYNADNYITWVWVDQDLKKAMGK